MANRGYLSAPHRLLPSYSPLAASRAGVAGLGSAPNPRSSSPPEFSYDAYPRGGGPENRGGARDGSAYTRAAPPSPANSALSIAYQNVSDFPYGLSGVQMPTYNFGSELYNYVSNGFPRKSRMCSFCNKVFTRSTTRRYHEKRCPLLRASNSLAKNEENNTAAAAAAAAALKEQQQRHKEAASAIVNPPPSAPRSITSGLANTPSQAGSNHLVTPTPASPPPPSLHPAYPTPFSASSALGTSPSRSAAAAAYSYGHPYSSHFYNSISAAALASLDQNSNPLQSKKESDNVSWSSSSTSPSSKLRDHGSSTGSIVGNSPSFPKSFMSDSSVDLTARYCSDFSLRSQPPVFPPTSLRGAPRSPPSPEPGESKVDSVHPRERRSSASPQEFARTPGRDAEWSSPNRDKPDFPDKLSVTNLSGSRLKPSSPSSSSPPPLLWNNKLRIERAREQYMSVQPVDDDEDDDEEGEDEEEVEEDEEQFNDNSNDESPGERSEGVVSSTHTKSSSYNPLVCQFCKKSFSDTITRQAHEALHSQTKSFGCCLCSHAFHCAYSLRIHLLRHHHGSPYKCKQCSRTFDEIMALKSHLLSEHSLPKAETCSLKYLSLLDNTNCSSSVTHNGALSDSEQDTKEKNTHIQRRSADSLPDVLSSNSDQTSNSHRAIENNADPVPNGNHPSSEETEVCKICNKAFAKSFIRFHERAHADQKPYECPICNKRFGYKNNMKSHMKLHQGLKPYQCQICGARFTRGSTLRRHGRRHNISRNSMLDYVLYDHNAGPTRAPGVNKGNISAAAAAAASGAGGIATTHPSAAAAVAAAAAAAAVNSQYAQHNRLVSPNDQQHLNKSLSYLQQSRPALTSVNTGYENERYGPAGRHTSPKTSPQGLVSPRATNNHMTSVPAATMASPMVGGLAAVAAANLFAYPAAAAPHLYQFYASTNQLMSYSAYAANQNSAANVQSDALNLSLGKRKSPFHDENDTVEKIKRQNSESNDSEISEKQKDIRTDVSLKVEKTEEPGEMIKKESSNPFTPKYSPKKEWHGADIPAKGEEKLSFDAKESLKINTEDFAMQVNMCCPSPLVQSSTGSSQQMSADGSPVGSSLGHDPNIQPQPSPSGLSHHSSPANSAPSPSNSGENQLQELLLSLLASGRMFRCSFCDIYFTEYAMFRLHQKYHQSDMDRPFLCSVCGEDCKDKTYFTVHLSEHLGLSKKSA